MSMDVEKHSLLWVTKERDNFFKFYTDNEKQLSKAKLTMQAMANALKLLLSNWPENRDGMDNELLPVGVKQARAALAAAQPFLEEK